MEITAFQGNIFVP